MGRFLLCLLLFGMLAMPSSSAEPDRAAGEKTQPALESVVARFAAQKTDEVPDFQRHVTPLLGKLGCNARECHGSFQGRGGFRLSLFGYDFKQDVDALLDKQSPRVDLEDPQESLIIQKPTDKDAHSGGQRYDLGSWQHHVLLRWIEAGAKFPEQPRTLTRLEIEPAEILFRKDEETIQLLVIAVWPDGSREDVTPLCRLETSDPHVVTMDGDGRATCQGRGDTHIIVSYDRAVVPVPVLRPVTDLVGERFPDVPTPTKIDKLVVDKLRKLGIAPSELCSDGEFLRRVSLDIAGTLPQPDEVDAFVGDKDPQKRSKKIEQLLDSPSYVSWWTTKLSDFLGMDHVGWPVPRDADKVWYPWLRSRVARNIRYDDLAEALVPVTTPLPGQSYAQYCEIMSDLYRKKDRAFDEMPAQGAFWQRAGLYDDVEKRAIVFAYAFMGTRIQCAQCHKHPYDEWSKQDFHQFKSYFTRFDTSPKTRPREERDFEKDFVEKATALKVFRARRPDALFGHGLTIGFPTVRLSNKIIKTRSPDEDYPYFEIGRLPGRKPENILELEDPRQQVMHWLRSADNPYFARAFANRVWASYFHTGIVSPTDDLSVGNPPSNKPLLDFLAGGFRQSGFDMKWLHRTIATSRTYQLSWRPNESNRLDERHYSHAIPRRLPAEVLNDAIRFATSPSTHQEKMLDGSARRSISIRQLSYAVQLFGRMPRSGMCECDRSSEPTQLQTLYLQNDRDVLNRVSLAATMLMKDAAVHRQKNPLPRDDQRSAEQQALAETTADVNWAITQAFLRTLSRHPSEIESERMLKHVSKAENPAAGMRDVMWVLLNMSEFTLNH